MHNASQFASSLEEIEMYEWDSMERMKQALCGSGNSNYIAISQFSDEVTKNEIFSNSKRFKAKNCDYFRGEVKFLIFHGFQLNSIFRVKHEHESLAARDSFFIQLALEHFTANKSRHNIKQNEFKVSR